MFTWAGARIDAVLDTYVSAVLGEVFNWTAVLAAVALTLYILLYGIAVVRGEVSEPVSEFVWKAVKLGLIIAIATSAAAYRDNVQQVAEGLTTSMAAAFRPTVANAPTPGNMWQVLEDFNARSSNLVLMALKTDTNKWVPNLMAYFLAFVFSVANCVFLIVAFAICIFSRSVQAFTLAVGPLFILCLMWRPTSKFFDAWLGMLLSTVVLVWLAYFVLGFSVGTGLYQVQRMSLQFPTLNHAAEAIAYLVLMVTLSFVLYQAPSLAASLTGGGPSQYGAGLVRDIQRAVQTLMPSKSDSGGSSGSGGSARKGTGLPYAAGRAAGASVRHAASGAQALASGAGAAGRYAYQRAAAMGRRILNK